MAQQPARVLLGSAAVLAILGVVFTTVLVADDGDNAYAYLAAVGVGLIVAAAPFAMAAILPAGGGRRALTRVALGLLALVGLLGSALLALSVLVIPSQDYESDSVLWNHVIALVALVAALALFTGIYRRRSA